MLGRKLRTCFDLIKPDTNQVVETKQNRQVEYYGGKIYKDIQEGSVIMVRSYKDQNNKDWVEARMVEKIGNNMYLCKTRDGDIWKRHKNQIRELNSEEKTVGKIKETEQVVVKKSLVPRLMDGYVGHTDQAVNVDQNGQREVSEHAEEYHSTQTRPKRNIKVPLRYKQ